MSEKIKVYQKPTCTTCRKTLGRLNECGVEFEAINYYETPLTEHFLNSMTFCVNVPVLSEKMYSI